MKVKNRQLYFVMDFTVNILLFLGVFVNACNHTPVHVDNISSY